MKVTLKYCKDLLDRYGLSGTVSEGSSVPDAEFLRLALKESRPDDRFRVSYDHANCIDDEDTWDLIGPGAKYGNFFYSSLEEAEADRDALNGILREHLGPVSRKPILTPDAHLARSLMEGWCCPACGSGRTEVGKNNFYGSAAISVPMGCCDCNAEWTCTYALQGYRDIRLD